LLPPLTLTSNLCLHGKNALQKCYHFSEEKSYFQGSKFDFVLHASTLNRLKKLFLGQKNTKQPLAQVMKIQFSTPEGPSMPSGRFSRDG
jgi:hypothetical protein